ncbi:unnamed protein product [Chrysoparadoxa australica]
MGKMLTRCSHTPLILPFYHIGLHDIMPEEQRASINMAGKLKDWKGMFSPGGKVIVCVGTPIDVSHVVKAWEEGTGGREKLGSLKALPWEESCGVGEKACHTEIAAMVREKMLELEEQAAKAFSKKQSNGTNRGAST